LQSRTHYYRKQFTIFVLPKKEIMKHSPPYFVYSHARNCVQVLAL
jgi:hypothetical protein